jgi:deoxycytidylate deaminase
MKTIPAHLIELAHKLSLRSDMRHKIGAVIFNNKNYIISVGYNKWLAIGQPHSNGNHNKFSIHAEVDALTGCSRKELWGASILVVRSTWGLAKPCPACQAIILNSGIKNVYFSNGKNKIEKL